MEERWCPPAVRMRDSRIPGYRIKCHRCWWLIHATRLCGYRKQTWQQLVLGFCIHTSWMRSIGKFWHRCQHGSSLNFTKTQLHESSSRLPNMAGYFKLKPWGPDLRRGMGISAIHWQNRIGIHHQFWWQIHYRWTSCPSSLEMHCILGIRDSFCH